MPTESQELALVGNDEAPLALMKRADIPQIFASFEVQIAPLEKIANDLQIVSADQVGEIAIARTTRLSLKKLRVAVENRREELKEGILEEGRKIDRAANKLKELIKPLEEKLAAQEKIAERLEAERKAKLGADRAEALKPFGIDPTFYALADMPPESWEQLLENSRVAFEAKKAEAARLEQERIAADNARLKREAEEAAERVRVKAENERLRAEAVERDRLAEIEREAAKKEAARLKKLADDAEAARKSQEAAAAHELKEAEERAAAELRTQQEAAERFRLEALERSRKEREAIEAKAREDKEAAEALARKEREKREAKEKADRIKANKEKAQREAEHAEQLAEQQRKASEALLEAQRLEQAEADRLAKVEADRVAAEAAALEAAKAPDREKLVKIAQTLIALPLPDMTTESGSMTLERVEKEIASLAAYIVKKSKEM